MNRVVNFIFFFLFITCVISAQDKPERGSSLKAEELLKDNKLEEAKSEINKAFAYEIYKAKSKGKTEQAKYNTYYIKGQIYEALADKSEGQLIDDYLVECINDYKKAIEIKGNKETDPFTIFANQRLQSVYAKYVKLGIEDYNNKDYKKAMVNFERSALAIPADTNLYANILNCAFQIQDTTQILKYGRLLLDMDFKKDYIYLTITKNAFDAQDYKTSSKYALDGAINFPTNKDFINLLVESHVKNNTFNHGVNAIKSLIDQQPKNAYLAYVLGYTYERNDQLDNALVHYKKAIELDPNLYDAVYNAGVIHYNAGVHEHTSMINPDFQDDRGNIKPEYEEKIKNLKVERNKHFEKALPYILKASKLKKDTPDNYDILYRIYDILEYKKEKLEIQTILDTYEKE